jgi:hypothetical protein
VKNRNNPAAASTNDSTITRKTVLDSKGNVTALPNIGEIVQGVIPKEVSGITPWTAPNLPPDRWRVWESFRGLHVRVLQLEVSIQESAKSASKAVVDEEAKANRVSSEKGNRFVAGEPKSVEGLEGKCLSFPLDQYNALSVRNPRRSFRVSGVRMSCGIRNVFIVVQWQGMDYSTPGDSRHGKGLDYETSRRQAIAVMRPIVASLYPK